MKLRQAIKILRNEELGKKYRVETSARATRAIWKRLPPMQRAILKTEHEMQLIIKACKELGDQIQSIRKQGNPDLAT